MWGQWHACRSTSFLLEELSGILKTILEVYISEQESWTHDFSAILHVFMNCSLINNSQDLSISKMNHAGLVSSYVLRIK